MGAASTGNDLPDGFSLKPAGGDDLPSGFSLHQNLGSEEPRFRQWYAGHAKRLGLDPDPDNPEHHYDYRAAFRAGAGPDETGHWPSKFKDDDHPNRFIDGMDTKTGRITADLPDGFTVDQSSADPHELAKLRDKEEVPESGQIVNMKPGLSFDKLFAKRQRLAPKPEPKPGPPMVFGWGGQEPGVIDTTPATSALEPTINGMPRPVEPRARRTREGKFVLPADVPSDADVEANIRSMDPERVARQAGLELGTWGDRGDGMPGERSAEDILREPSQERKNRQTLIGEMIALGEQGRDPFMDLLDARESGTGPLADLVRGSTAEPDINPEFAFSGGFVGGYKTAVKLGWKMLPTLMRSVAGGAVAVGADYPLGMATEKIREKAPALTFPFALAMGLISGATIEPYLEQKISGLALKMMQHPGWSRLSGKIRQRLAGKQVLEVYRDPAIDDMALIPSADEWERLIAESESELAMYESHSRGEPDIHDKSSKEIQQDKRWQDYWDIEERINKEREELDRDVAKAQRSFEKEGLSPEQLAAKNEAEARAWYEKEWARAEKEALKEQLVSRIKAEGGIDGKSLARQGFKGVDGYKELSATVGRSIFKTGGLGIDEMAQVLYERGLLQDASPDELVQRLLDYGAPNTKASPPPDLSAVEVKPPWEGVDLPPGAFDGPPDIIGEDLPFDFTAPTGKAAGGIVVRDSEGNEIGAFTLRPSQGSDAPLFMASGGTGHAQPADVPRSGPAPFNPPADQVTPENFKPLSRENSLGGIADALRSAFPDVPVRVGLRGMAENVKGAYWPFREVIRTRTAHTIATLVHEYGHHFQKLLGLKDMGMPREVQRMAYTGADNLDQEGFAEFVRVFVTHPEEAKRLAPNFDEFFRAKLAQHPDIEKAVFQAQRSYHAFRQADSVQRVVSKIVKGRDVPSGGSTGDKLSAYYRKLKDEFHPLLKAQLEALNKAGKGKLKLTDLPYDLARAVASWPAKAEMFIKHGTFRLIGENGFEITGKPLAEILSKVKTGEEMDLLGAYLVSKRIVNDPRTIKGFENVIDIRDFNETIRQLEPRFKDVAEELYKYNDSVLQYLVDARRISIDDYEEIKKNNLFYVPLYRVLDDVDMFSGVGGKKLENTPGIKRLKGSGRDMYDPIESMIYNTYYFINAAERNRVGVAMSRIADIVPGLGKVIEPIPPKMRPIQMTAEEAIKSFERETGARFNVGKSQAEIISDILDVMGLSQNELKTIVTAFRPDYTPGKNEILFHVDGQPRIFRTDDQGLLDALRGVDASTIDSFWKFATFAPKLLRAGAITYSVRFGARNIARDVLTHFIQSEGWHFPALPTIEGIFHYLKKDDYWKAFMVSGGPMSSIVAKDRKYISKNFERILGRGTIKGVFRSPIDAIAWLSQTSDEWTRIGEFAKRVRRSDREGVSRLLEAGMASRDATVDFARMGSMGRYLNALSFCWNARMEGYAQMARSFKARPVETGMKAILSVTIPSLLEYWFQKDDPYYQELPEWRRALCWNIIVHEPNGSLSHVLSIPKPFEWGMLWGTLPVEAIDWLRKKDPIDFKNIFPGLMDLIPIPTAALPIMETGFNHNLFYGRSIEPRGSDENLSAYNRSQPYTSETAKLAAKMLKNIPWVNEFASPARMEHLLLGYTAGIGRLGLLAGDEVIKMFAPPDGVELPEKEWYQTYIGGTFATGLSAGGARSLEELFERRKELKFQKGDAEYESGLSKIRKLTGRQIKTVKNPELVRIEKGIAAIQNIAIQIELVKGMKDVDPKTKREVIANLNLARVNVARSALEKETIPVPPEMRRYRP